MKKEMTSALAAYIGYLCYIQNTPLHLYPI